MTQNNFIPFARPWIGDDEIDAVSEVLASKWISTGPKTAEFERRFAEYIGVKHALAVSSCTAALHLSLVAAGIGEGDEVITTPYTFTATSEAIGYTGAKPVFVDIDPKTLNIDVDKISEKLTARTKAILPVHIAGAPCDMDALLEICKARNLVLIDDAAHAIPTDYKGRRIGSIGDLSVFSFYANKNLTAAEGGMITTNCDEYAKIIEPMRLHGLNKDSWARQSNRSVWHYQVDSQGYKYNMTDIQAAMGLCQLMKLNKQIEVRGKYIQIYQERLGNIPEIVTPPGETHHRHSWHLYIIQLRTNQLKISRDEFVEAMRDANIECSVHYIPLHLFSHYQKRYGYREGDFPYAEEAFERVVSLPLHMDLTVDDVHTVVDTIRDILS
ncbi:MAG: DegT/DnrJ/EryC1/StrS family aminotransferase [Candidatus Poribacteria bacterium]|nr:DegT/DnrJ/EryC1/StrS family aminotransferase [Candidatus Poribacteria bacterium]MDE0503132.1 DegT/DnrJ/EryC1/StrS family aminotransferase [Candidatus Poribacteria bacterium]